MEVDAGQTSTVMFANVPKDLVGVIARMHLIHAFPLPAGMGERVIRLSMKEVFSIAFALLDSKVSDVRYRLTTVAPHRV